MVKFLKPGKVVILLTGRYAGKKAVIVKNHDDGDKTTGRAYGHALVVGLSKEPRKEAMSSVPHELVQVIKRSSQKTQAKRSSMKTFIKAVNYQHMMPTRYSLDVDLKSAVPADVLDKDNSERKKEARKAAKTVLTEKWKSGKNKWFYSKLKF